MRVHGCIELPVLCWAGLFYAEQSRAMQEPEEVITDLQKELFTAQGIDGVWGIACLSQVCDLYQDDLKFMKLFVSSVERWVLVSAMWCWRFTQVPAVSLPACRHQPLPSLLLHCIWKNCIDLKLANMCSANLKQPESCLQGGGGCK